MGCDNYNGDGRRNRHPPLLTDTLSVFDTMQQNSSPMQQHPHEINQPATDDDDDDDGDTCEAE